jgi:hypothetical protein
MSTTDNESLPSPTLKTALVVILVHLVSQVDDAAPQASAFLSPWLLSLRLFSAHRVGSVSAAAKIRARCLRRCTGGSEGSGSRHRAVSRDPTE